MPATRESSEAAPRGQTDLFDAPSVGNYLVSTYPPFSTWTPEQSSTVLPALSFASRDRPFGLYVHVPFCFEKCHYCHYVSYAGRSTREIDDYLWLLHHELALLRSTGYLHGRRLAFAFVGGGTPSILDARQIRRLGRTLRATTSWHSAPEVTWECAPKALDAERLDALHELGVTRLSMGVQSFSDRVLELNGRTHLSADVERAVELVRDSTFGWLNLDLMAGLPGETRGDWDRSITRVIDLVPDSVTLYQTEIPPNTRLARELRADALPAEIPSWAEKRRRVAAGFEALEAAGYTVVNGYSAVRDPAHHRFLCQHHLWSEGDMLGLGVASYSWVDGVHFQNDHRLSGYRHLLTEGQLPVRRARRLTEDERVVRALILRLKWGRLDLDRFERDTGVDVEARFPSQLAELESRGWLVRHDGRIELTRAGLLRVDLITPLFYLPEHQQVRSV